MYINQRLASRAWVNCEGCLTAPCCGWSQLPARASKGTTLRVPIMHSESAAGSCCFAGNPLACVGLRSASPASHLLDAAATPPCTSACSVGRSCAGFLAGAVWLDLPVHCPCGMLKAARVDVLIPFMPDAGIDS